MHRLLMVWIAAGLSCSLSFGQRYGDPLGKLSEESLKEALAMDKYEPDSTCDAVILIEKMKTEVKTIGTFVEYLLRVKVLDKSAVDRYNTITILVPRASTLDKLEGYTYNIENGRVTTSELTDMSIMKTRHSKTWDKIQFAMPNVREGSVFEYSYKIVHELYTLPGWKFQNDVPTLWSEYYLNNTQLSFMSDVLGGLQVEYQNIEPQVTHRWFVADAPAFKPEPLMPTPDRFVSSLEFWRYQDSWLSATNLWYQDYFGDVIRSNRSYREVKDLVEQQTDPRKKIKLVSDYLKSQVAWTGYCDYTADPPGEILKQGKGTSGDINLLLISMLTHANIDASPVLLSTRENGYPRDRVKSISQFNYVICQAVVGSDTLLLDATDPDLPYNTLPLRCHSGRGLLVTRNEAHWITIRPPTMAKTFSEGHFELSEDGTLAGVINHVTGGYAGAEERKLHRELGADYHHCLGAQGNISDASFPTANNPDEAFNSSCKVSIADYATYTDETLYLNAFISVFSDYNQFKPLERTYPLDFEYPQEKVLISHIKFPKEFSVEAIPKSQAFVLPGNGARASFNYSITESTIHVVGRLQMTKTTFMAEEYKFLREFFSLVVGKSQEQIVLKKK